MFKHRRNRVLALCAGERRLLVKVLLSFRNKLVASGKPTEDTNELLIRLLRYERLLLKKGRRLFLWHQFCCHTDELQNVYGITFDAIDEKWLHFGATSSPAQENGSNLEPKQKNFSRGLIFRLFRCLPSEGINIFSSDLIFGRSRDLPLEGRKVSKGHGERIFRRTLKMPL